MASGHKSGCHGILTQLSVCSAPEKVQESVWQSAHSETQRWVRTSHHHHHPPSPFPQPILPTFPSHLLSPLLHMHTDIYNHGFPSTNLFDSLQPLNSWLLLGQWKRSADGQPCVPLEVCLLTIDEKHTHILSLSLFLVLIVLLYASTTPNHSVFGNSTSSKDSPRIAGSLFSLTSKSNCANTDWVLSGR